MKFLVTGGKQKGLAHFKDEWHQHKLGLVAEADFNSGECRGVAQWESPAEHCPKDDPSIQFKGSCIVGKFLAVCSTTEVVIYDLNNFEPVNIISLPMFNDLHHVCATPSGSLLVANTGLDMVLEVELSGKILGEWNTAEVPTWDRFDPAIDYRLLHTTKPHHVHPNAVFVLDGNYWATRFEQRDAVCLTESLPRIPIGVERPHDGFVVDGKIWFTTVDGHLVVSEPGLDAPLDVFDLNEICASDLALGWCRGLHVLPDGTALVGFTRLRPSAIRANLRWLEHRFGKRKIKGDLPTRICHFDLVSGTLLGEVVLEKIGMNSIFSIIPVAGG